MFNIQAAMGVAQLENIDEFIQKKKKNYQIYKEKFDAVPGFEIAATPGYSDNNHWFYALQMADAGHGSRRDQLMSFLEEEGIQTRPVWYLNHRQRPYLGCRTYEISTAVGLWEKTLNIPCSVGLPRKDLSRVADKIAQFSQRNY